ncbi:MAG: coproporphyrinogen III oxidase family protein [Deferrisomatales bacterium]|nr:coproporphyrinogen III oxidase family protein [Deferrisomatales bacterium]
MLAERILTPFLRWSNRRILSLDVGRGVTLPPPSPDRAYLLYLHVPFCQRLCPYCSFNRYPFSEDPARSYFRHLREEMRLVAGLGYDFSSVYVGGGTPTILVDELCSTLDLARELYAVREVSCETNPNHLIPEVVDALCERVQRLSVGVQSFDDGLLRQMDRYDKYGSGEQILDRLQRNAGRFHSLNVDMIFNFPSQTQDSLLRDVECLKRSGANQTTFYPLMTSPAVRRSLARTVGRVDYGREHRYYRLLSDALEGFFEPATAWTFSRKAGQMIDEYIVDYEEYVGVGSGSFSYLGGALYANTFSLQEYEEAVGAGRVSAAGARVFPRREQMRYRLMMGLFGLRLDKQSFRESFGVSLERGLPLELLFLKAAGALGREDGEALTLTPRGRYLLVAMMREFFAGVNNFRDQARASLTPEERALLFGDGPACPGPREAALLGPSPGEGR